MAISVMFVDGTYGVLSGEELDEQLNNKRILAFWRSSGLAIVGRDEFRGRRGHAGSWRDRKSIGDRQRDLMIAPLEIR